MAREIKSSLDPAIAVAPQNINDYKDRLVKLIPSEIVTAYVTILGIINDAGSTGNKTMLLWIVFGVLFVLNPLYLYFISNVKKSGQIIFTSVAFIIWVITVGSPVPEILSFPSSFIGSICLILYTLIIPFAYKG